jgi:hypothetical protein
MGVAISLNNDLVLNIKRYASLQNRSVPKQIEHWVNIGKIAEENSDLPYSFIQNILLGLEDMKAGEVEEYQEGCL